METVKDRPPGKFGFRPDCFRRIFVNEQAEFLNKISTVAQLQLRKGVNEPIESVL